MPLVNNKLFEVTQINGQTVGDTALATATVGGVDGDTVNNVQALPRIIVLDLQIKSGVNVEDAKRDILKVVKLKKRCTLEMTQNGRTSRISGVVQKFDMPRWTNKVIAQITLHCDRPFWEDVDEVVQQISEAIDLHYFTNSTDDMLYFPDDGIPFGEYDTIRTKSFYNDGDVDVGLEITILAHDTVTNPIIYDQHGNFFGIGYTTTSIGANMSAITANPFTMQAGDNVVITTHRGRKTVTHNGVPVFDKIKPNSTWLQLETGDNTYSINSDDNNISNMSFSLVYKQRYL